MYGEEFQYIYTDRYQKERIDLQNLIRTYGNLEKAFNDRNESIWNYDKVKKSLDNDIANKQVEIEKQKEEIEKQQKEIKSQRDKIKSQQDEIKKQKEEIDNKNRKIIFMQEQNEILKANTSREITNIMKEYQTILAQYENVTESKIWTLSKPLRKLIDGDAVNN